MILKRLQIPKEENGQKRTKEKEKEKKQRQSWQVFVRRVITRS
jgi:hypothetical protein